MASRRVYLFRLLPTDDMQLTLFESDDLAVDIKRVLVPTRSIERYNRIWRLSAPIWTDNDRVIGGKLGFDALSQRRTTVYDESKHDFVAGSQSANVGTFVHYALHCDLRCIATEVRPPDIRPNSVRAALEEFIQSGRNPLNIKIEHMFDVRGLHEWVNTVERVARITANMERANPSYRHKNVEAIFEGSGAEDVQVDARASEDGTLTLPENSPMHEFAEYAEDGHGSVDAYGSIGNREVFYRSGESPVSEQIEVPEDGDVGTVVRRLVVWMISVIDRMS